MINHWFIKETIRIIKKVLYLTLFLYYIITIIIERTIKLLIKTLGK